MNFVRLHRAPPPAKPARDDDLDRLLLLAQEGFYWQGDVEDLLVAIRDDGDLGELARAGGPIISRYERMRLELRTIRHPDLREYVDALAAGRGRGGTVATGVAAARRRRRRARRGRRAARRDAAARAAARPARARGRPARRAADDRRRRARARRDLQCLLRG